MLSEELEHHYQTISNSHFDSFSRKVKFFYDWTQSEPVVKKICDEQFNEISNDELQIIIDTAKRIDSQQMQNDVYWNVLKNIAEKPEDDRYLRFSMMVRSTKLQDIAEYVFDEYIGPSILCIKRLIEKQKINHTKNEILEPKIKVEGFVKIFISHATVQSSYAHQFANYLKYFNIETFVAHDDIEVSDSWQIKIEEALENNDVLVVLKTPESQLSAWVNQEIGFTYHRRIPIMTFSESTDPIGFIQKFQAKKIPGLFGSDNDKQILKAIDLICSKIIKNENLVTLFTINLINSLIESQSYVRSQRIIDQLQKINILTNSDIKNLEKSKSNYYVKEAFHVIDKIDLIIEKNQENI